MRKQSNYARQTKIVSEISNEGFDAFLGILNFTAGQKDNHMPTKTFLIAVITVRVQCAVVVSTFSRMF